jgi:hypothetical protein
MKNICTPIKFVPKAHNLRKLFEVSSSITMLTNIMFTTLIAEELRALISSTILMINSFFVKAIVWMCLSPAATVGGIPHDPASSDLIVALEVCLLVIMIILRAFISLMAGFLLLVLAFDGEWNSRLLMYHPFLSLLIACRLLPFWYYYSLSLLQETSLQGNLHLSIVFVVPKKKNLLSFLSRRKD